MAPSCIFEEVNKYEKNNERLGAGNVSAES